MKRTAIALLLILLLPVSACASSLEWIAVADNAFLPDESIAETAYPASVRLGDQLYDLDFLLNTLLGEDYITEERGEYDDADEYRSAQGDDPWEYRTIRIYDASWQPFHLFSYHNPWVHGERGGEYEAPQMNMTPDESLVICRSLLRGIVPDEWLQYVNRTRWIRDRWDYSDRWMTDEEYSAFTGQQQSHYFTFNAVTEAGIPLLSEQVFANIGVDGLSMLEINWHEFTESSDTIYPMSLKEALEMANSTRSAPCFLLSAELVYSNWLTENDTHNLSWYLVTDHGSYVVDCVLRKHKCDSYEY